MSTSFPTNVFSVVCTSVVEESIRNAISVCKSLSGATFPIQRASELRGLRALCPHKLVALPETNRAILLNCDGAPVGMAFRWSQESLAPSEYGLFTNVQLTLPSGGLMSDEFAFVESRAGNTAKLFSTETAPWRSSDAMDVYVERLRDLWDCCGRATAVNSPNRGELEKAYRHAYNPMMADDFYGIDVIFPGSRALHLLAHSEWALPRTGHHDGTARPFVNPAVEQRPVATHSSEPE